MDFNHPLLYRLGGLLAGLGGVISLIFSILAGASLGTIIFRLIMYMLFMAALGVGIFFLLQFFAPEIIEVLQQAPPPSEEEVSDAAGENLAGLEDNSASGEFYEEGPDLSSPYASEMEISPQMRSDLAKMKKNVKPGEGEIVVEGVKLPNKPELMAEAIRDTLDRDSDE